MIIDGTQGITGVEQEGICLCFIDKHLEFTGFYEVNNASMRELIRWPHRLDLPVKRENLMCKAYRLT